MIFPEKEKQLVKKKVDILQDAFLDFDSEAASSLDQIFDKISVPVSPVEPIEQSIQEEDAPSETDFDKLYNYKIYETLEDIEELEAAAVEVTHANIDNLYKGTFIRDYAKQYHLDESDVKEKLRLELANQLKAWGMKCVNKRHYALPREIKHIIRMDFYGTVDKVKDKRKLEFLNSHSDPENTLFNEPADYDLTQSPSWMVFRQFRSFRLLEKKLPEMLIEQGITPSDFPRLNPYELSQILYNNFIRKSKPGAEKSERANLFLGAKYRFVKNFIRQNKEAFYNYMDLKGYDPRYTKTLIKHMELHGTTGNFDVIEETYTPQMLEQLKRRKLVPEETEPGDPITDNQAEFLKANGMLPLILARDENGDPLSGPEITVHHKNAVQDSGENTNFADVNLFKNLCLITEPYHFFAHSLDRTGMANGAEYYVSRIEIKKGITFYGGFNPLYQIKQDFAEAHYNEFDKDALDNYQNKEKLFAAYWEDSERKSRKNKKKEKQNQKKLEQAQSSKETENNEHKKEKKRKTADPYNIRRRELKIKQEEERKNEALIKRKEQQRRRNEKRAALKTATNSPKQSSGYTIIQPPTPQTTTENNSAPKAKDVAASSRKQKNKQSHKQNGAAANMQPILKENHILIKTEKNTSASSGITALLGDLNSQKAPAFSLFSVRNFVRNKDKKPNEPEKLPADAKSEASNWQPVAAAPTNQKPVQSKKSKKQKTTAGQTGPSAPQAINKQLLAKQNRIEELEQIKAKTIAKFQAQRKESNKELTPQEELKLRRTIQYMLRQQSNKR